MLSIGIDFGGSFVSVIKKGEGIVFKEPALISVKNNDGKYSVEAMGKDAKLLQDKNDESILTFSPISDGLIKSADYTALYIKYMVKKVFKNVNHHSANVLISVPCGINKTEIQKYKDAIKLAGFKKFDSVSSILCGAIGANLKVENSEPITFVDIGGSKTDVAVMANLMVISGATLGIGGKAIDNSVINILKEKEHFLINGSTAENIKNNIGSLIKNDVSSIEVKGINTLTNIIEKRAITAKSIRDAILPYFTEVSKVIKATIIETPSELHEQIIKNAIRISGGLATLTGVAEYLTKDIGIACTIVQNNENAVVKGLGRLLTD